MLDRKLPLNSLRAFEATARRGSLTAAASELQVSVAAVSRHVSQLEAYLGCTLLLRTRSGVHLTERGRGYFPAVGEAFERIEAAARLTSGEGDRLAGELNLSVYSTFATEWLTSRLQGFRNLYPNIRLRLKISTDEANFDCDRVDLALTARPTDHRRYRYDQLFEALMVPVCSPELAERCALERPEDIHQSTLLFERRERVFWQRWFKLNDANSGPLRDELCFDCTALAYQAARKQAGVALGQLFYLADELAAGTLAMPVPRAIRAPFAHHLMYSKARADEPVIATFRQWLLDEAGRTAALISALDFVVVEESAREVVHA